MPVTNVTPPDYHGLNDDKGESVGDKPAEAPLDGATQHAIDKLKITSEQKAKLTAALAAMSDRAAQEYKDKAKALINLEQAKTLSLTSKIKVPPLNLSTTSSVLSGITAATDKIKVPPLPTMSSISSSITNAFKGITTPDINKLTAGLAVVSAIKLPGALGKFKDKKTGQILTTRMGQMTQLLGLMATVNAVRSALEKKK